MCRPPMVSDAPYTDHLQLLQRAGSYHQLILPEAMLQFCPICGPPTSIEIVDHNLTHYHFIAINAAVRLLPRPLGR